MQTVSNHMTSIFSQRRASRMALIALIAFVTLAMSALPSRADTVAAQAAASSAAASLAALDPPLPVPDANSAEVRARSAQSGTCPAQICNRDGKGSTLRVTTYKYRFVKIKKGANKGKFKRKVADNPPAGQDDASAKKAIKGAYQAGLQNVKKLVQTR